MNTMLIPRRGFAITKTAAAVQLKDTSSVTRSFSSSHCAPAKQDLTATKQCTAFALSRNLGANLHATYKPARYVGGKDALGSSGARTIFGSCFLPGTTYHSGSGIHWIQRRRFFAGPVVTPFSLFELSRMRLITANPHIIPMLLAINQRVKALPADWDDEEHILLVGVSFSDFLLIPELLYSLGITFHKLELRRGIVYFRSNEIPRHAIIAGTLENFFRRAGFDETGHFRCPGSSSIDIPEMKTRSGKDGSLQPDFSFTPRGRLFDGMKESGEVNIPTVVGEVELSRDRVENKVKSYTHPGSPVMIYFGVEMRRRPANEEEENFLRLTVACRDKWSPSGDRISQKLLFCELIGPDSDGFQERKLGKLILPYHLIYDGARQHIPEGADASGIEIDLEKLVQHLYRVVHDRVVPTPGCH